MARQPQRSFLQGQMVKVLLFQLFAGQRVLPVKEEPLAICAAGAHMILVAMEKSTHINVLIEHKIGYLIFRQNVEMEIYFFV